MNEDKYAEKYGIECAKDGFRVRVGRKTYLPGIYLTLYQAEQAMMRYASGDVARAQEVSERMKGRTRKDA